MRVTLLNQSDAVGGAAVACKRLLVALNKNGTEANMLVAEKTAAAENGVVHFPIAAQRYKLNWMWERIKFLPHERNKSTRFLISTATDGLPLATHPLVKQAEVLHLHWINKGFLSLQELQKMGRFNTPIIWTLHDMWAFTGGCHYSGACRNFEAQCGNCVPFLKNPGPKDLTFKIWQRKLATYNNINLHIVTCSEWLAQEARKSSLLGHLPIRSIPNPIDTTLFLPAPHKENGSITLLFQAMNLNDERKGWTYLIQALHYLAAEYPEHKNQLRILLFGKAENLPSLPYPVEYLGSLKNVSAIVAAYQKSDLFVIPSLEENLPNTIMEAMACGLPVVGFNSGGIPEMIDHKANGYVAELKNAIDLANGIHYVISDPERRIRLGQKSRQLAESRYAEAVVAQQYQKQYLDALNSWT